MHAARTLHLASIARRARVERRNAERGQTFAMHVPPDIFELASALWEPPDAAECQQRDVRFMS